MQEKKNLLNNFSTTLEMTIIQQSIFAFKLFLFILLLGCSSPAFSQYKISKIIEDNKVQIPKPYKYDGFLMNEFSFDQINKNIPIEFVAFKKQKYKLIFCSSTFEESVKICIYDKANPNVKVAEKIIDSTNTTWTYEPVTDATYTIIYEIPPSNTEVDHKACMVMLIGFKGK